MPYICLARGDVPDGTLQILDLLPNTSQRNSSIDPPGQTRYINRAQNGRVQFNTATGKTGVAATGLQAYLMDHVEPGGILLAFDNVNHAGVLNDDTITIAGVVFKAAGAADFVHAGTALDPIIWNKGNGGTTSASNFRDCINDAGVQVILTAALGAGLTVTASVIANTKTLVTANQVSPVFMTTGTFASSNGVRLIVNTPRMTKTVETWTGSSIKTVADLLMARVDAGSAMALADINTILQANVGAELTAAGGSQSTGAVVDILEILAGREYSLPAGSQILNAVSLAANPSVNLFVPGVRGSFTKNVGVYDTQMLGGELRPLNALGFKGAGDVTAVERKPIRATQAGDSFHQSVQDGALSKMRTATNVLFPDSDMEPFIPTTYQKAAKHTAKVANARLVTVYNNDGSLA